MLLLDGHCIVSNVLNFVQCEDWTSWVAIPIPTVQLLHDLGFLQ